jgi:hypothetical protein
MFTRNVDSADIGYVFADTARNTMTLYGVLGSSELIAQVHEFRRTGNIKQR